MKELRPINPYLCGNLQKKDEGERARKLLCHRWILGEVEQSAYVTAKSLRSSAVEGYRAFC